MCLKGYLQTSPSFIQYYFTQHCTLASLINSTCKYKYCMYSSMYLATSEAILGSRECALKMAVRIHVFVPLFKMNGSLSYPCRGD